MTAFERSARSIASLTSFTASVLCTVLAPFGARADDDRYVFAADGSRAFEVRLVNGAGALELSWDTPPGIAWDTALLGVRVRTTGPAAAIELQAGDARVTQYLDAEASGLRWLNLTSLKTHLRPGVHLALRPSAVVLEPGTATLRLFRNRIALDQPMLIVAPHPDDAEIAAFGLYASAQRASILTITSGNAGDAQYQASFGADVAAQYQWKGYLRAIDSVTVPWQGGIPPERCFNLGYFDGRLADMREKPSEAVSEVYGPNQDVSVYRRANLARWLPVGKRSASWQHLIEDLVSVLRKLNPSVIALPHPELDAHPDHAFTAVAISEAIERWKRPVTVLLYANHGDGDRYPYGPAGSVMALPPFSEHELPVERVFAFPLDAALQRRKLYALESMHDLRLSPAEQAACEAPRVQKPQEPRPYAAGYDRRALRSEETFLVADRAGLRGLVADFLARRAAGTGSAEPATAAPRNP